jgi:hypothetical protein
MPSSIRGGIDGAQSRPPSAVIPSRSQGPHARDGMETMPDLPYPLPSLLLTSKHYLMLPNITPLTKYRWQNKNTIKSGIITITAAVICKGQLVPP